MILSGMRIGELIALNHEDVDFWQKVIHVSKTYDTINKIVTTPKTLCSIRDVYMQPNLEGCCHELNTMMPERRLASRIKTPRFVFGRTGGYLPYFSFNKYLREN